MITEADIKFPDIPFRKTALLIVVGLVIYFGYLYLVGFDSIKDVLLSVDYTLILITLILAMVANVFHTLGWWVFMKALDYKISLAKSFEIYMSTIFFVNIIPSAAISGEIAKIYFVQKAEPGARFDKTLATGLISRLLEIVPVALGAVAGVAYLAVYHEIPTWALAFCIFIAGVVSLAAITVLAIALNNELLRSISSEFLKLLSRVFNNKNITEQIEHVDAVIQQFDTSLKVITKDKSLIIQSLVYIFIAYILDAGIAYVAFHAIGVPVSISVVVIIYSIMVILQLFPTFLPGGVGLVDIIMTLLYTTMGVGQVAAAGATIIIRFVTLWFLTAVGGIVTIYLAKVHNR